MKLFYFFLSPVKVLIYLTTKFWEHLVGSYFHILSIQLYKYIWFVAQFCLQIKQKDIHSKYFTSQITLYET